MTTHATMPVPVMNDLDLLKLLTAPTPSNGTRGGRYKRREAPLDPLLLAAAISSGPQVTRHHYHHQLDVPVVLDTSIDSVRPMAPAAIEEVAKPRYTSSQAPRSQRLKERQADSDKENQPAVLGNMGNLPRRSRGASLIQQSAQTAVTAAQSTSSSNGPTVIGAGPPPPSPFIFSSSPLTLSKPIVRNLQPAPLQVQCMARTRIPTPHGPAFLHLYRNNKDAKEHLAFVIDPAQLDASPDTTQDGFIRSTTLDAKWSEDESEMDRLTRGAYVGRLLPDVHQASTPHADSTASASNSNPLLPPLVRIHSECFTGETIGSMRCDCGEQLDEAIRQISQPSSSTSPGRGAVIYLRQEGRGIGLLSKIRAYNLQDMGHDTVQANLLLGHGADERRYDIAAAIMRDLGLEEVELLTNNPDKVKSLETEGIKVAKRRGMVPRSWQAHSHLDAHHEIEGDVRLPGATLIGGGAAHGPELEKYLRTKVQRMGHMLDLPSMNA